MISHLRRTMRALAAIAVLIPCVAFTVPAPQPGQPDTPASSSVIFTNVDIYVDPHGEPLAAYQLEFNGRFADGLAGGVQLVGIEGSGGAAGAPFVEPPAYDPAALAGDRVIIADFSTASAEALPHGKSRVARLHLRIQAPPGAAHAKPSYTVTLIAAGAPDGAHLQAAASVEGDTP